MKHELHCPTSGNTDHVPRYVAGTLSSEELDAFEIHLLDCRACQEAVQEGAAIRRVLLADEEGVRRGTGRRFFTWALPLAAAAVLTVWIARPLGNGLEGLGRVGEPPALVLLPVRAGADSATLLADRGIEAYQRKEYQEAAEFLAAAAGSTSDPGLHFFLGMAQLLGGSADRAVASLEAALEPPGNPYVAEAHFYLAKAWLLRSHADSALAHLEAVPPRPAGIRDRAQALADSILRIIR